MNGNDRIPPVPGPTLGSYQYPLKDKIELLDLLSGLDGEGSKDSGGGGHGHVFSARIGRRKFAIKIFKFVHIADLRGSTLRQNYYVDDDTLIYHSDPFFAECRAYGRIEEIQQRRLEKRKGKRRKAKLSPIVVRCYGHLEIPADPYEKQINEKFGVSSWDRPDWELELRMSERRPLRALVKRLVTDTKAIKAPSQMLADLELLRENRIYPQDIREPNYVGGLLVDLSFAWTEPHWCLEYLPEPARTTRRDMDLRMFNRMMKEKGITTVRRAGVPKGEKSDPVNGQNRKKYHRSEETMKKLRGRPHR